MVVNSPPRSPGMSTSVEPNRFKNIKKIGYGSYGIVYSAIDTISNRPVAIKRNIITMPQEIGFCTIREAETLTRVRGSPFVVDLLGFIPNSEITFPSESLSKNFGRYAIDDKLHFIQPLADYNLSDAFKIYRRKPIPIKHIKHFTLNILLGLEWIHNKGVIHRDVTPSNILVCKTTNTLKLCDFGMCANKTKIEPRTPGVVTHWYRAPDVTINKCYDEKIDLWALGAIMYEMISGKPLYYNISDNSVSLIKHYFKLFPFQASRRIFNKLYTSDQIDKFVDMMDDVSEVDVDDNKFTEDEILTLTSNRLKELSKVNQYYRDLDFKDELFINNFFLLMAKLLSLDPMVRPSAKDCITKSKSLFEDYSPYISSQFTLMTAEHKKAEIYNYVKIYTQGNYRLKAYKLFVAIYNQGNRIPWYNHRVLFHAVDLFEMFVSESMSEKSRIPVNIVTSTSTDYEIYLKVYVCLYMFHKIFNTMSDPFEWKRFAPKEFNTETNIKAAENFEFILFAHVARCRIYRPTLYELVVDYEGRESKALIKKCLQTMVNLDFIDTDDTIENGIVYYKSYSDIFKRIVG